LQERCMVEKARTIWVKYYTLTNGLHMSVDIFANLKM